jgi:Na+-driven multidrug efflux pump
MLNDTSIINEVYKKFLLFTPIIYFFEILFLLNVKFLNTLDRIKDVFIFILAYVLCHVGLSVMLMFFLDFGLFGLTISYGFNSIFFFFCTDLRIYNIVKRDAQNYFYLIPNRNNFEREIITNLREISRFSLYNLGEVFPNHFIFFASMLLGPEQLIVNIIYLNFFELVIEINKGFYYSIKRDIKNKIDDANDRQIYIAIFSTYYLLLNLPVFITLLIFKNILLNTYIYQGASAVFQELAGHLRIIYPLCIMAMAGKIILNGITRVMEKPMSIVRKIIYILISMFICYLLCFFNNFGLFGLWISMIVLDLLHVNENLNKVIRYFPCCSRDNN